MFGARGRARVRGRGADGRLAAAEAKLTKALPSVPDHAHAHALLGLVHIFTKRAADGIAECERALELDHNLAAAHAAIAFGKIFTWVHSVGMAKSHLGSWEEAVAWRRRAIEAYRKLPAAYFSLAAALAQLDRRDEAHSALKAGLALNPAFSISCARAAWTAWSDNPTYLAQLEPIFEGLRKAGVPEQ